MAGKTGSGKSFLAESYLAGFKNVIILDTKGFIDWGIADYPPIFTTFEDLKKFKIGKAIYRPIPEEMTLESYDRFFKWVYDRMNTVCYVDELMSIATSSSIPFYLKAILTRGRQRNTSMWVSTQRPSGIPLICMSEATHFFIFDLRLDTDRERIKQITGQKLFEIKPSEYGKDNGIFLEFLFFYYNDKMESPTLNIIKNEKNKKEVKTYG